jgi:hypothetical protein
MKFTHTLRNCLFFTLLVFTAGLISHALGKSPTPARVSPAPKKVSPAPAKVYPPPPKASPPICNRTIKVQVVALDQPWMWNRLGASQPGGMIYALARDVVSKDGPLPDDLKSLQPTGLTALCGKVRLRDEKRARPLVLRANKGDCLEITFVNLLSTEPALAFSDQVLKKFPPPTRWAGLNATGMELVGDISSDSSWVGKNANSLAKNGELKTYKWYAVEEGTFLIYSGADMDSGYQANQGLFGAIHVEPEGAEWYRSQITHYDLVQATLTKGDLKEYSRKLAPPEAAADPPVKVVEKSATTGEKPTPAGAKPPPGAEKFTRQSLESHVADKVSSVTVYVDESLKTEQRIHSATGQPLIYYNAVYTEDGKPRLRGKRRVPVLQMLQVNEVGTALYNEPLHKQNAAAYINEVSDLDAGIIPAALRALFKDKIKQELSAGARVVEQYRYSWLITDQGKAYYLQATPPTATEAGRLQIFNADLELINSDLTAVITGPNAGRFALSNTSTTFRQIPAAPDRRQPYREYTIIYHQAFFAAQAFASFSNNNLINVIQSGGDNFAINYGSGAIGPEVIANRLGVGPMGNKDSVDLKFEEFFLSAWAVGDPAMVVDCPANATNAIVDTPDKKRELHKEVPLGSVTQQISGATPPFPTRTLPPASDDFAPLPAPPMPATKAYFPDDPSNVYHSYMSDHVKFRILHAGAGPSHVHHLHAHQWLRSPDSDSSSYLDSQLIVPGSAFTLEITYNGSGNRNKTVGDSIFHCHFYPHFAQGMWALWRVHDVFEQGTLLDEKGVPLKGINRALPDGEIRAGTPIPAIVPLPTLGMAPMPAKVQLTDLSPLKPGEGQGRRVEVIAEGTGPDGKKIYKNPGYPFFIPGVSGHRPPHPPLDLAWLENPEDRMPILNDKKEKIHLDGGLPRHIVLDGKVLKEFHTRWDFSKDTALRDKHCKLIPGAGSLTAMEVPEEGTPVEIAAMNEHAIRTRPTTEPNGEPGNFILNGLPPTNGAPFADPGVNDQGNANVHRRRYQAAVFQVDTILNKKGWHYPQQRMISLWQDVAQTMDKTRPPEPFFFRTNTSDSIQFWHTNLLPSYYELDDFQVRTPTDIVGQHIHLVKFDVTASDGAGNGFNYEDGTFAPDEVQERIDSINAKGGLFALDPATGFVDMAKQVKLTLKKVADYYPPPGSTFVQLNNGVPQWQPSAATAGSVFGPPPGGCAEAWDGAQTTIQLWEVDSLLNNEGVDRTLRTVFSHDHFGPSTHQQAGLYAGMVVEPESSEWYLPYGERMNTRSDGGPTSWQGYIVTENPQDSYREFMLEFQDMQLAYAKGSPSETSAKLFDPILPPPLPPSAAFTLGQEHSAIKSILYEQMLQTYATALDKATLPGPFTLGTLSLPGFTGVFPQFGIPLSDKATVKVDQPGAQWTITEAPNQINAGAKYVVRATKVGNTIKKMVVFTPDITPGWASAPDGSSNSKFALNAPRNILNGQQDDPENFANGPPFAQIVSQNQFGTYSLNYRNEPVPFRVGLPGATPPPSPEQSDLALAFTSITRADPDLNIQPDGKTPGYPTKPLVPNAQGTDPYTPLLQAYVNDKVQIRTLVGAHTQAHAFQVHGVKWLFEPDNTNSGWRNAQLMGLSEHYEMKFDLPGTAVPHKDLTDLPPFADYFYSPSAGIVGLNNGLWGIMRAYGDRLPYSAKLKDGRSDPRWLEPLPNNRKPQGTGAEDQFKKGYDANSGLRRDYDITAVTASVLPTCLVKDGKTVCGQLVYNQRDNLGTDAAVLYVRTDDLEVKNGKTVLKAGVPIEPLILRAAAGEWIKITLRNGLAMNYPVPTDPAFKSFQRLPYGTPFAVLNLPSAVMFTSTKVGLHPQLVGFDPIKANGMLVGFNPQDELVPPLVAPVPQKPSDLESIELYWYAGELKPNGAPLGFEAIPIEFGATNLTPADPLLQSQFGMVGALIVEPEGSTWAEDTTPKKTYASATVTVPGGSDFREFVVIDQNMVANNTVNGVGAINYRSEPFRLRGPKPQPTTPPTLPKGPTEGFSQAYSNSIFQPDPPTEPETPIFVAAAGTPVRFRLLIPGTETSNALTPPPVFMVHSHPWQEEPYINDSTKLGFNALSETQGAQQGGVGQKFDLLFPSAGGQNKIPGDYLYTTYQTAKNAGTWGLFRVTAAAVAIDKAVLEDGFAQASGVIKAATDRAPLPKQLRACLLTDTGRVIELGTTSVAADGRWTLKVASDLSAPARIQVTAIEENGQAGATATAAISGPSAEKLVTRGGQSGSSSSP